MSDEKRTMLEEDFAEFSARVRRVCKRAATLTLSAALIAGALLILSVILVFTTRFFLVPSGPASLTQDLVFDYTSTSPVAKASFVREKFGERQSQTSNVRERMLSPRQNFDVEIEFIVPNSEYNFDVGMFQVDAKMKTRQGKTLVDASRPGIVKYTSKEVKWLKTIVWWPLHALGLIDEQQNIQITMVKNYKENAEAPFTDIEVTMKPRAGSTKLPQIYEARAIIHLSMGIFVKILYFYPMTSFVIIVGLLWSSLSCFAFFVTALSLLIMGTQLDETVGLSTSKSREQSKYAGAIADAMDSVVSSQAPGHVNRADLLDEGLRRRNVASS